MISLSFNTLFCNSWLEVRKLFDPTVTTGKGSHHGKDFKLSCQSKS